MRAMWMTEFSVFLPPNPNHHEQKATTRHGLAPRANNRDPTVLCTISCHSACRSDTRHHPARHVSKEKHCFRWHDAIQVSLILAGQKIRCKARRPHWLPQGGGIRNETETADALSRTAAEQHIEDFWHWVIQAWCPRSLVARLDFAAPRCAASVFCVRRQVQLAARSATLLMHVQTGPAMPEACTAPCRGPFSLTATPFSEAVIQLTSGTSQESTE